MTADAPHRWAARGVGAMAACELHDHRYDLLRQAATRGTPLPARARRAAEGIRRTAGCPMRRTRGPGCRRLSHHRSRLRRISCGEQLAAAIRAATARTSAALARRDRCGRGAHNFHRYWVRRLGCSREAACSDSATVNRRSGMSERDLYVDLLWTWRARSSSVTGLWQRSRWTPPARCPCTTRSVPIRLCTP